MDLTDAGTAGDLSLLERVEAYLVEHDCPPTWFGWLATGSPSLVGRMRKGKGLRPVTVELVKAQLRRIPAKLPSNRRQIIAGKYAKAVHEQRQREKDERERRLNDPVEQAAQFLRRQGWMVARARVFDETATGWACGRLRLDDDGLLQRARDKGWEG